MNRDSYKFRKQKMILGLPFDEVSLSQACGIVRESIRTKKRCFISTPNLNFVINSLKDPNFKESVLVSDLNLADGMPIVWASRFMGEALPERVAGSTLFEQLVSEAGPETPFRVFFFGGDKGIAEQAHNKLNSLDNASISCGFIDPGRGDIESMSSEKIIDCINQARPDFLVVALGAKKGQAWILNNQDKLDVPVISHLGAVVNFMAGNVQRSPLLLQKIGLEWLWRIIQEPYLWRRYFFDGIAAIRIFAVMACNKLKSERKTDGSALLERQVNGKLLIKISGQPDDQEMSRVYEFMNKYFHESTELIITYDSDIESQPELFAFITIAREMCKRFNLQFDLIRIIEFQDN